MGGRLLISIILFIIHMLLKSAHRTVVIGIYILGFVMQETYIDSGIFSTYVYILKEKRKIIWSNKLIHGYVLEISASSKDWWTEIICLPEC